MLVTLLANFSVSRRLACHPLFKFTSSVCFFCQHLLFWHSLQQYPTSVSPCGPARFTGVLSSSTPTQTHRNGFSSRATLTSAKCMTTATSTYHDCEQAELTHSSSPSGSQAL